MFHFDSALLSKVDLKNDILILIKPSSEAMKRPAEYLSKHLRLLAVWVKYEKNLWSRTGRPVSRSFSSELASALVLSNECASVSSNDWFCQPNGRPVVTMVRLVEPIDRDSPMGQRQCGENARSEWCIKCFFIALPNWFFKRDPPICRDSPSRANWLVCLK